MNSNSPVLPRFGPAFDQHQHQQRQQTKKCSLPLIPDDLVQPLRDALPKIDEALLSTVPLEALPLCQQLFNAWISTSTAADTHIAPPTRAKTTVNIASLCPSSSTSSLSHDQAQSNIPKQCRKSQSTSRLSSWFSWSIPKRKNPSVAPMVLQQKKLANQNISDAISVNANPPPNQPEQKCQISHHYHQHPHQPQKPQELHTQQHHRHDQVKRMAQRSHSSYQQKSQLSHYSLELPSSLSSSLSTSTSTSASSKAAQRPHAISYRRSISFMLSKIGSKVRKAIQSGGQRIHPQLKSVNSSITMSLSSSSQNDLIERRRPLPSSSRQHLYSKKTQTSAEPMARSQKTAATGTKDNNEINSTMENSTKLLSSTDDAFVTSTGDKDNSTGCTTLASNSSQQSINNTQEATSRKDVYGSLTTTGSPFENTSNTTLILSKVLSPLPTTEEPRLLFDAAYHDAVDDESYMDDNRKRNQDIRGSINNNTNCYYVYDSQDDDSDNDNEHDDNTNLKTPWSPPQPLTKCVMKSSKTDTDMKSELSVPFIKMGLGRKSLDVEDQVQYTTRSISSASFALQWQEKFHDQQLPRDRIVSTLKSVSLSLYDIIRHNHSYQHFTSDTTYVAHPDLLPGENARQLFATVPLAHWRDIFDQMAYIYDNGVLTAEHAIITLIYIKRMLGRSKQHLCEANWRLIVLAGLMTAVKVWDDYAVYNMDFVQIFPELDIKHINLIERRFLEHIHWDVSVRCSLFASTYFDLRSHI